MKTYRTITYEVISGEGATGVLGGIVDIIEYETDAFEPGSGKNIFHVMHEIEADINARSEEASEQGTCMTSELSPTLRNVDHLGMHSQMDSCIDFKKGKA